jgi:hypothetical protein
MPYPLGGYPGNDDDGRELQKKRTREEMLVHRGIRLSEVA